MKNNKVKKLNKSVNTIYDYNAVPSTRGGRENQGGDSTDTTVTWTIMTTTINTGQNGKG
jgi:hypothetical protein